MHKSRLCTRAQPIGGGYVTILAESEETLVWLGEALPADCGDLSIFWLLRRIAGHEGLLGDDECLTTSFERYPIPSSSETSPALAGVR